MHRNFSNDRLKKTLLKGLKHLLLFCWKPHTNTRSDELRNAVQQCLGDFSIFQYPQLRKTSPSSYTEASRGKRPERWTWWQRPITLKEAPMLVTRTHGTNAEAGEPVRFHKNLGTFFSFPPVMKLFSFTLGFLTEGFPALHSGICALHSSWKVSYSWSILKDKT